MESRGVPHRTVICTVRDDGEKKQARLRRDSRVTPRATSALGLTGLSLGRSVVLVGASLELVGAAGRLGRLAGGALRLALVALTHDDAPFSLARSWPYSYVRVKTRRVLRETVTHYFDL